MASPALAVPRTCQQIIHHLLVGVGRAVVRPVWREGEGDGEGDFVPRRILPISLSYDHRVIDGAEAARFTTALSRALSGMAELLL